MWRLEIGPGFWMRESGERLKGACGLGREWKVPLASRPDIRSLALVTACQDTFYRSAVAR
jgi:hypothetical protein